MEKDNKFGFKMLGFQNNWALNLWFSLILKKLLGLQLLFFLYVGNVGTNFPIHVGKIVS